MSTAAQPGAARLDEPLAIGPLRLANRIVRAAAFEGMCPDGRPAPSLTEHHRSMAAGGAAMTTVAYASVAPGGRTFRHQMWVHRGIAGELRQLTDAVHREGAAASIQLGHAGNMSDSAVSGEPALAPSRRFNLYGLCLPRAMSEEDLASLVDSFGSATRIVREAGFDAVEIQAGHGYLLSQFLSPYTNRRRDRWGGSLEQRARLLRQVLRRVHAEAGTMAVTVKMNLRDGFEGGLELDEGVEVARIAEAEGAHALQLSGGFTSKTPWYILRGEVPLDDIVAGERRPLFKAGMSLFGRYFVEPFPYSEAYFLDLALSVRKAVSLPLLLVGGMRSRAGIERVLASGIDGVALARALIYEPGFSARLLTDPTAESQCTPCNRCVAAMYHGEQHCPLRSPNADARSA